MLGSKVYLVAKTEKFNSADEITFKIYEKEKLIVKMVIEKVFLI